MINQESGLNKGQNNQFLYYKQEKFKIKEKDKKFVFYVREYVNGTRGRAPPE